MRYMQGACKPITVQSAFDNDKTIAEQRVLFAMIGETPVGFCVSMTGTTELDPVFIQLVGVVEAARGSGIGTALMLAVAEQAPHRTIAFATQDDNLAARRMNESFAASIGAELRQVNLGTYKDKNLGIRRGLGYRCWTIQRAHRTTGSATTSKEYASDLAALRSGPKPAPPTSLQTRLPDEMSDTLEAAHNRKVNSMAQKVTTHLVDDLTGDTIEDGKGRTVSFSFDGGHYEIDLTDDNADALREAFSDYVAAARKVTGRSSRTSDSATPKRGNSEELAKIREWANANGHEVSSRGRISQAVRDAYDAAH